MEIYRVTYKQLSPDKRKQLREGENFVDAYDYPEWVQLIALRFPDMATIERILRSFVTLKEDELHWLHITNVELLGSALVEGANHE